jgi:hypothetical protein
MRPEAADKLALRQTVCCRDGHAPALGTEVLAIPANGIVGVNGSGHVPPRRSQSRRSLPESETYHSFERSLDRKAG